MAQGRGCWGGLKPRFPLLSIVTLSIERAPVPVLSDEIMLLRVLNTWRAQEESQPEEQEALLAQASFNVVGTRESTCIQVTEVCKSTALRSGLPLGVSK